jgi:hypothetical protein
MLGYMIKRLETGLRGAGMTANLSLRQMMMLGCILEAALERDEVGTLLMGVCFANIIPRLVRQHAFRIDFVI